MRFHKTVYVFLALFIAFFIIEFWGGIGFLRFFWGTAWFARVVGVKDQPSFAETFAQMINQSFYLLSGKHLKSPVTAAGVITFFVWLFVGMHVIYAVVYGLIEPFIKRLRMGVRKPSDREFDAFNKAFAQIASASGEQIRPPRVWKSADGLGLQTRWAGYVLIIDRKLFTHRFFAPLLAHELGNSNSEDRLARRFYAMLPWPRAVVGTLGGFPFGIGHVLLYPAWQWLWRQRIYAADAFAVRAGQGPALERALETLYLNADRTTRWGREWKPVPYVEQRIDRLQKLNRP
ncbi:MAG: hypothetical protein ACRDHW_00405 [Ktedonobacteraceae bacterium]